MGEPGRQAPPPSATVSRDPSRKPLGFKVDMVSAPRVATPWRPTPT
jgi:hypothetical protein